MLASVFIGPSCFNPMIRLLRNSRRLKTYFIVPCKYIFDERNKKSIADDVVKTNSKLFRNSDLLGLSNTCYSVFVLRATPSREYEQI